MERKPDSVYKVSEQADDSAALSVGVRQVTFASLLPQLIVKLYACKLLR